MEYHPSSFIEISTVSYVPLQPRPTSLHSKACDYPGIHIDFLFICVHLHFLFICVHLHICMQKYLDEWAFATIFCAIIISCNFLCRRCWITADLLPKYIAPCLRLFCYVAHNLQVFVVVYIYTGKLPPKFVMHTFSLLAEHDCNCSDLEGHCQSFLTFSGPTKIFI